MKGRTFGVAALSIALFGGGLVAVTSPMASAASCNVTASQSTSGSTIYGKGTRACSGSTMYVQLKRERAPLPPDVLTTSTTTTTVGQTSLACTWGDTSRMIYTNVFEGGNKSQTAQVRYWGNGKTGCVR